MLKQSGDRFSLRAAEKQPSENFHAGVRRRSFKVGDAFRRRGVTPGALGLGALWLTWLQLHSGIKTHSLIFFTEYRVSQNGQCMRGGGTPSSDLPQRRQHRSGRQRDNLVIGNERCIGDGGTEGRRDGGNFSPSLCLSVSHSLRPSVHPPQGRAIRRRGCIATCRRRRSTGAFCRVFPPPGRGASGSILERPDRIRLSAWSAAHVFP